MFFEVSGKRDRAGKHAPQKQPPSNWAEQSGGVSQWSSGRWRTSTAFRFPSSFYLHFTAILLEETTSKGVLWPIKTYYCCHFSFVETCYCACEAALYWYSSNIQIKVLFPNPNHSTPAISSAWTASHTQPIQSFELWFTRHTSLNNPKKIIIIYQLFSTDALHLNPLHLNF